MSIIHERARAVADTLDWVRSIGLSADPNDNTPERIAEASLALRELASRAELFPPEHFPPKHGGNSGFYRLSEGEDFRYALYISVSPAKFFNSRPHRHAHWAFIGGVAGTEHNVIYERADDGSQPGRGKLRKTKEVPINKGTVLFVARDEYHTVEYDGQETAINLHLYGLGLDSPEGLVVPSFPAADADYYETDSRAHSYWGVPKAGVRDLQAALEEDPALFLVAVEPDADAQARLPFDVVLRDRTKIDASVFGEQVRPVILVGDLAAVEVAAERLARKGYRNVVQADLEDIAAALAPRKSRTAFASASLPANRAGI